MSKYSVPPDVVSAAEIDVTGLGDEPDGLGDVRGLANAIRNIRRYGEGVTYLTDHGERVAAIVAVSPDVGP
jgi:hypothetical protein